MSAGRLSKELKQNIIDKLFGLALRDAHVQIEERCRKACDLFHALLVDAEKLYDHISISVHSFKTERQLVEALPEAAQFIPQRVTRNEMVPKEFTDRIREAINKGIPPFNAGEEK